MPCGVTRLALILPPSWGSSKRARSTTSSPPSTHERRSKRVVVGFSALGGCADSIRSDQNPCNSDHRTQFDDQRPFASEVKAIARPFPTLHEARSGKLLPAASVTSSSVRAPSRAIVWTNSKPLSNYQNLRPSNLI